MWCRAILTITLLACTFQRTNGQSYDTKDLLCVLVLSGLQKEDLDLTLLKKLQRHNVNIDDLDNVDIQNECKLDNANKSDNKTKNDVQKPMGKQFEANHNTSDKVVDQNTEVNSNKEKENISKLIKLIGIIPEIKVDSSITPELNLHSIKDETTTATVVKLENPHIKSEPKSITYINKVLQQFIGQVDAALTTTTTTPTTPADLRSILYEIKNMLANKSVNRRKDSTESKNDEQEYNYDDESLKTKVYTKKGLYKKKGMRQNADVDQSQEVSNERPTEVKFYTKSVYDGILNKNNGMRRRKENFESVDQTQESSNEQTSEVEVYREAANDRIINKKKGMRRRKANVALVDQSQEFSNERPTKGKIYTKAVNDKIVNKKKGMRRRKKNDELVAQSQEVSNEPAVNDRVIYKIKGRIQRNENVELVDQSQESSNERLPEVKGVNDRVLNKKKSLTRRKENDELVAQSQEVSNERPTEVKAYTKAVNENSNERPIQNDTKSLPSTQAVQATDTGESVGQILIKNNQPIINQNKFQDDIKIIQGNMIKDIAESVKTMVLQNLKKEMSSTLSTTSSTTIQSIATKTETEATTVARAYEKDISQIIQLYEHLKNNIIPVDNRNIIREIKTQTVSIMKVPPTLPTMPNNSYQNPIISHIYNNLQVPNDLTKLNTEMQTLPIYRASSINRIDQVNIFNPKHEIHPLTIQTNIGQIPPISVPMIAQPIKLIYQNIVVTTENSFEHFKSMHKLKTSETSLQEFLNNNGNKQVITKPNPKSFDYPRHRYRVERMRSPTSYRHRYNGKQERANNVRIKNRDFEKFHEKLERADADDWYSNEGRVKKVHVAPRLLRPINDNRPKFDDTHFRNFLKTQQKVNDMLERILATKPIVETKSVEIP